MLDLNANEREIGRNEITGKQFGFFMNMDSAASLYAMEK